MNTYKNERCIIIDESGNLGVDGRYFVIACIDTKEYKALHNIMVRKLGIARTKFPDIIQNHAHEIKAADAYPCVKYHLLECISSKELSISYIVVDKSHVKQSLFVDKNILYNYLTKILLSRLITNVDNGQKIHIICDNHTTKITSVNSFSDYIKLYFNFEEDMDIGLDICFLDSDASNSYVIQAADYVANAIYTKYEYNNDFFSTVFKGKVRICEQFPYKLFGT